MPFLTRGKARYNRNRFKNIAEPPANDTRIDFDEIASVPSNTENPVILEEPKIIKQEVTYRVPKEERLLDLPLEEEIFEEEEETNELDEQTYNIMPVGNPVSIGAVLKKKKRR